MAISKEELPFVAPFHASSSMPPSVAEARQRVWMQQQYQLRLEEERLQVQMNRKLQKQAVQSAVIQGVIMLLTVWFMGRLISVVVGYSCAACTAYSEQGMPCTSGIVIGLLASDASGIALAVISLGWAI